MIRAILLAAAAFLPFSALAQDREVVINVEGTLVAEKGAILRGLDRINGTFVDIEAPEAGVVEYERLEIELVECRYPEGQQTTEAFAHLKIRDKREALATFEGWMFASSPALSALDHPRYDIWVLRCNI